MILLESCPVCKAKNFTPSMNCKDYTVSQETFSLVTCKSCNFKFTNPRPHDSDLGRYYQSEDYISHSNTTKGIVARLYHTVRNHTLKAKLNLIQKYVSRGTILDYGCGTGMFLKVCAEAGWKCFGIEPDDGARNLASVKDVGLYDGLTGMNLQHPKQQFDVITLWHVLEHVTDLENTLGYFRDHLSKGGALVIAVPNHKSFDADVYQEHWAAYDVPRHLYHFHKETISQLLGGFGFELHKTLPMKFDSFYVSMLSEKYKTGSVRYLSAFIKGLKSNLFARKSGEYSSRIYVFKRTAEIL